MVPPKRSPKKTMAAWVADLEEGAVRAPAGISSGAPPPSPGKRYAPEPRRPPPYQTMDPDPSDPAPASAPAPASRPAASRRATTPAGASAASSRASSARGVRGTSTRSTVSSNAKASLVRRHANRDHDRDPDAPAPAEDARPADQLWDRVAVAMDACADALDEASHATANDGVEPAAGTPGFGRTSNSAYGGGARAAVSGTTRKKLQSRAAVKVTAARVRLRELTAAFDGARNYANALSAALSTSESAQSGVVRQLQSTAGYAEETTARLRQTSAAHRRAEMTAKQLGEALDAANAHIADVSSRLEIKTREAAEVVRARELAAKSEDALERAERAEESAAKHKEAVAKLTADNMVFLMRLKESETELAAARAEADEMRGEIEDSRGTWFDRARKDVERVVQRAMRRAEEADAALEAEIQAGEQRAEEWGAELAKMNAVLAQNEALARTTEAATTALDDAVDARRRLEALLDESKQREFDALVAQKAATEAMAAAREDMGVLKQKMASTERQLEKARRDNAALAEKASVSVAALATQQTINAGVMQKKNDMEWRVLEMQAAFEKAGLAVETPRRAGRPGDATENAGGIAGAALSPMPAPLAPTPELVPKTNRGGDEASVDASVEASVDAPAVKAAVTFAPPPPVRAPRAADVACAAGGKSPSKKQRAKMSTTAAPLVTSPKHHAGWYGTAGAGASGAGASSEPGIASGASRGGGGGGGGGGSLSARSSPSKANVARRRDTRDHRRGSSSAPASPAKPAFSVSPMKRGFANSSVADARRASAEWSRRRAKSYAAAKTQTIRGAAEFETTTRGGDDSDSDDEVEDSSASRPYERLDDVVEAPERDDGVEATTAIAKTTTANFKSSMAAAAAAAARHAAEVSVSGVADDDAEEAIVAEEVFLRAAARGARAGGAAVAAVASSSAAASAATDFGGWIGGRPTGEGVAVFPSSASLATASSDDEGPDVRRGPAAPPRVVAFDDSDDGDASDGDVGRGPPLVARGPGPARYGSADPVDAPAALSNSIDEYGVAEEHEAAMTHLLSASVGARSYGATTTSTTNRDATSVEDASRDGDGDGNGPVVRFGNAIPIVSGGGASEGTGTAGFKRRRGGGTEGVVSFTNALPRIR